MRAFIATIICTLALAQRKTVVPKPTATLFDTQCQYCIFNGYSYCSAPAGKCVDGDAPAGCTPITSMNGCPASSLTSSVSSNCGVVTKIGELALNPTLNAEGDF